MSTKSVSNVEGILTPSTDLVCRLEEIIEWRRTGVSELNALRAYAEKTLPLMADFQDVLRIAEERTLLEAARLVVAIGRSSQDSAEN